MIMQIKFLFQYPWAIVQNLKNSIYEILKNKS